MQVHLAGTSTRVNHTYDSHKKPSNREGLQHGSTTSLSLLTITCMQGMSGCDSDDTKISITMKTVATPVTHKHVHRLALRMPGTVPAKVPKTGASRPLWRCIGLTYSCMLYHLRHSELTKLSRLNLAAWPAHRLTHSQERLDTVLAGDTQALRVHVCTCRVGTQE